MKDDTISRQAAIDAAHKAMLDYFDLADDVFVEPLTYTEEKFLLINKSIATRLEALPPVQPEEPSYDVVKDYCQKRCLSIVDTALLERLVAKYASMMQDIE